MAGAHTDDTHTRLQPGIAETLTGISCPSGMIILTRRDIVVDDRPYRRRIEGELRDAKTGGQCTERRNRCQDRLCVRQV